MKRHFKIAVAIGLFIMLTATGEPDTAWFFIKIFSGGALSLIGAYAPEITKGWRTSIENSKNGN